MSLKNTANHYGAIAKFFHWTVALAVIGLLIVGFIMGNVQDKALKMQIYNVHKLIGLVVLGLMLLRLVWRLINVQPVYPAGVPNWERKAARGVHDLLYLALITMPISGWMMSAAAGRPPHLGRWLLAMPGIEINKGLAHYFNTLHGILAWIIAAALVVHLAAALKHHCLDKNEVLMRMLPFAKHPNKKNYGDT